MNEEVYFRIRSISNPLDAIYALLALDDAQLRYYRIIHEWECDRKNRLNKLITELTFK